MKRNKYNKRLRYRENPMSGDKLQFNHFFSILFLTSILKALMSFTNNEYYSDVSKSVGIGSIITVATYTCIVKPKILNGSIEAFYRRNYKYLSKLNNYFILMSYFSISRFLVNETLNYKNGVSFLDILIKNNNNLVIIGTTVISGIMLYLNFFQDKYITIAEFSDRINFKMKFNDKELSEAVNIVYKIKDKEYGIKEFDGTYFKYADIPVEEKRIEINKEDEKSEIEKVNNKEETLKGRNLIRREMRDSNDRNKMDEKTKEGL